MSGAGLLASALGGALGEGANEAVRQSDIRKQSDAEDLQYQRKTALESLRANNNQQNSIYEADRRAAEGDKDRASRERIANLASKRDRQPTKAWEPITQKDIDGNVSVIGKFNTVTGEKEMFGAQEGGTIPDELMMQAEDYADKVVKEKAGLLSTDSTDFSRFDGSRTKAREYYKQEFLNKQIGADPSNILEKHYGPR